MDGGAEQGGGAGPDDDSWWSDVFGGWEPSAPERSGEAPALPAPAEAPAPTATPPPTPADDGAPAADSAAPVDDDTPTPVAIARPARRARRGPIGWARRPWTAARIVRLVVTAASLGVTTYVMMNVVHLKPFSSGDLITRDSTPTGGDMGAHVWAPAYLRDSLLPHWQISGWTMDWYGGFPIYRFYMVVPALAIVALDTFLPYGVAFKFVAVSGLVSLPACCWAFGRLARFRYPIPELFAFAGLCFALNESYSIYGGNVLSTMAGEFSFSIAISLMMLGLGLLARGLQNGKLMAAAALVLALACLCHGIVLIYTAVAAVMIVGCRLGGDLWFVARNGSVADRVIAKRRLLYVVGVGVLTVALSAFWVGPFLLDHQYMTDMKYGFRPSGAHDSFWDMFFDLPQPFDVLVTGLAIIGLIASIARRHVVGVALGLTGIAAVVLVYLTRDSLPVIGLLWNPRVLPLLYLMRFLLMMVGVVELGMLVVNLARRRDPASIPGTPSRTVMAIAAALVVLVSFGWFYEVLPLGGHRDQDGHAMYAWGPLRKNYHSESADNPDIYYKARGSGWSAYNFQGYEARKPYPEFYELIQTMDQIGQDDGCGRALWEVDNRKGVGNLRYGSTWALMMLPYWTDGCIASMEGLYFEASGTTPYHFLTAAAMSSASSNPVRQLRYVNNDAEAGVPELQALGVRYLMVTTEAAIREADAQPELTPITESGPWKIYQVADSDLVVPLAVQPVVVNHRGGDQRERWLEVGTSWFQNQDDWAAMPAADGPSDWQRVDVAVDEETAAPRRVNVVAPVQPIDVHELDPVTVSNVDIEDQSVQFDVDQVGVPVLVKVSYFPNWRVDGAEGPYRIGPNQMVVVPTSTTVRLHYERSTSDWVFMLITAGGIVRSDRSDAADASPPARVPAAPAPSGADHLIPFCVRKNDRRRRVS